MLPEIPSAAQISEYVCDLEHLFSRKNVVSYRPTAPHLWLVGEIPLHKWEGCRSTSERERHTHTYHDNGTQHVRADRDHLVNARACICKAQCNAIQLLNY